MPKRKKRAAGGRTGLTFNHAMIYVRDLKRALHFYRDRLGFRLIEAFPGYARVRSPGGRATIALHKLGEGVRSTRSQGIRLYFESRGLDALCRRLAAAGVKLKQKPRLMPWGWMHAYLDDPDGHELSLYWAGAKRLRRSSAR